MTSLRLAPSRATLLAAALASALLAGCGGGGGDSAGTTSTSSSATTGIVGTTFKGFVNLSHREPNGDVYAGTGRIDVKVDDAAGNASGTTQVNSTTYPVKGTISPQTGDVALTVSPATGGPAGAGGTITAKLQDRSGFSAFVSDWSLKLPMGSTGTLASFVGTVEADNTASGAGLDGSGAGGSGSGSGAAPAGNLVGTWTSASVGRAVEVLSGTAEGGTGEARNWSSNGLDGVYTRFTWSVSGTTKKTTVTLLLACDFYEGRWVALPDRPTGSLTFTLSGDSVTYSNAPTQVFRRSTDTVGAPSAGGACSRV